MRILLFGITGFTGGNLARELLVRGHEVTGVARGVASVPSGATLVAGDVYDSDAVSRLADGHDAIVVAVPPRGEGERVLGDALPGLLAAAEAYGIRLGFVGGASSLQRTPGGPLVFEGIPEHVKTAVSPLMDLLELLRATSSPADWFYLSPPPNYGAHLPGERRGRYRLGGDVAVTDGEGVSSIGGEDFAIAFVDELESPQHRRMRFTVGY